MKKFVLDASVLVKMAVEEEGTKTALSLLEMRATGEAELIAPDLIVLESANAFWKYYQRGLLPEEEVLQLLGLIQRLDLRLAPLLELIEEASALSLRLGTSVYDSIYVALAQHEDAQLVTADKKLCARAAPSDTDVVLLSELS